MCLTPRTLEAGIPALSYYILYIVFLRSPGFKGLMYDVLCTATATITLGVCHVLESEVHEMLLTLLTSSSQSILIHGLTDTPICTEQL